MSDQLGDIRGVDELLDLAKDYEFLSRECKIDYIRRLNQIPLGEQTKKTQTLIKRYLRTLVKPPEEAVIYTDGGARPNPGVAGWGFHMYLDNGEEINGFGALGDGRSNNAAEAKAVERAITYANDLGIEKIEVNTDSEYVLKGIQSLPRWESLNWRTSENGPELKNQDVWKPLHTFTVTWKEENKKPIKYKWVKGHSGIEGNELADLWATCGIAQFNAGYTTDWYESKKDIQESEKNLIPLHPLIAAPNLYFRTGEGNNVPTETGYHIYHSGSYVNDKGDNNRYYGKRAPDCFYCLTLLKKPESSIEGLRERYEKLCGSIQEPIIVLLRVLKKSSVFKRIWRYGHRTTLISGKIAKVAGDNAVLAHALNPPRQVYAAEKQQMVLLNILTSYQNQEPGIKVFDITSEFIRINEKQKQIVAPDFTTQEISKKIKAVKINTDTEVDVTLSKGIDYPERNTYLHLTKRSDSPIKVELLVWDISPTAYRVGVLTQQDNEYALTVSPDSGNRIFNIETLVKAKKKST